MACSRGHSNWFKTKRVGKKRQVCEFILAHRQSEGNANSVIFCGDLAKNKKIPVGYLALS